MQDSSTQTGGGFAVGTSCYLVPIRESLNSPNATSTTERVKVGTYNSKQSFKHEDGCHSVEFDEMPTLAYASRLYGCPSWWDKELSITTQDRQDVSRKRNVASNCRSCIPQPHSQFLLLLLCLWSA